MSKIKNPHDKFFKSAMTNKRVAKGFLKTYLPATILEAIDLEQLKIQKESYISESLRLSMADVVFEVAFKSKQGQMFILIEHQSVPEKLMPFRILKYTVAIMDDYLKRTKNDVLPIVFPMIFYTGIREYNYSANIMDLIGDPYNLLSDLKIKSTKVIKINKINDVDLQQDVYCSILGLVMKRIKMQYVEDLLYKIRKLMQVIIRQDERDCIDSILSYIFIAGEVKDPKKAVKIVEKILTPSEAKEQVMGTLAQYFREEGREEGMKEGIKQGAIGNTYKIARNMMDNGFPITLVAKITKLSVGEINSLAVEN